MWSRAQPMPRLGSVHEESELRVPQPTSSSIVARSDVLSTDLRRIAPDGGAGNLGCGLPCAGSAGSSDRTCAATGTTAAEIANTKRMDFKMTVFMCPPEGNEYI